MVATAPAAATKTVLTFESGKTDLSVAAVAVALNTIAGLAKEGGTGKFAISGFHDASGDPAKNAELAKQRQLAVRDALKAAGIAEERIEMKKPEEMNAGSAEDARRVEVSLM